MMTTKRGSQRRHRLVLVYITLAGQIRTTTNSVQVSLVLPYRTVFRAITARGNWRYCQWELQT